MPELTTPDIRLPETTREDPRIGHLLGRSLAPQDTPRAVIVGFPSDEGVRRNRGRPGAAEGPDAIRACFYRFTPGDAATRSLLEHTRDLGNLAVSGDLEADQRGLGETLAPLIDTGIPVVVLGGGHETAYGHFLGYAANRRPVRIVNLDAHADVRELRDGRGHSGSPFRQILEHESGCCRGYSVLGLQRTANAEAHLRFLDEHDGLTVFADDVNAALVDSALERGPEAVYCTFCLDALDQAFAPGVSAPAAGGLMPDLWLHAAHRAGATGRVSSMDIVELNPTFDRDQQTGRLAARTLFEFLRGLAER